MYNQTKYLMTEKLAWQNEANILRARIQWRSSSSHLSNPPILPSDLPRVSKFLGNVAELGQVVVDEKAEK